MLLIKIKSIKRGEEMMSLREFIYKINAMLEEAKKEVVEIHNHLPFTNNMDEPITEGGKYDE